MHEDKWTRFCRSRYSDARGEQATQEDLVPAGEKWRLRLKPDLATQGATLRGAVRRSDGRDLGNAFLTVWEVDERGHRENLIAALQKVSQGGSFEVRYLSPRQYWVTAEDLQPTPTARLVGEFGKIELAQGQTYADVNVLLHPEPVGRVSIRVIAPKELHDRIFVWLRDADMDSAGGNPYKYAETARLDDQNVASFMYVPYSRYDVYVMPTGEDISKPSWTHDDLEVRLSGGSTEAVIELRKVENE